MFWPLFGPSSGQKYEFRKLYAVSYKISYINVKIQRDLAVVIIYCIVSIHTCDLIMAQNRSRNMSSP